MSLSSASACLSCGWISTAQAWASEKSYNWCVQVSWASPCNEPNSLCNYAEAIEASFELLNRACTIVSAIEPLNYRAIELLNRPLNNWTGHWIIDPLNRPLNHWTGHWTVEPPIEPWTNHWTIKLANGPLDQKIIEPLNHQWIFCTIQPAKAPCNHWTEQWTIAITIRPLDQPLDGWTDHWNDQPLDYWTSHWNIGLAMTSLDRSLNRQLTN